MLNKNNNLDQFWMPFTANRQFKAKPRLLESASGMYFTSSDGRQVLDGTAGLWCCNAGHGRREITEAVSKQIAKLDFAPTFQMGHPLPFERLRAELPRTDKVDVAKLIELCQELAWVRSNDSGVAALTPRGARVAQGDSDAAKLRLALLDYVEIAAPPWVKLAIDGRKKLLTFAPSGVAQCLVEADLVLVLD